jgi:translation initiation factor IF-3
MVFTKFVNEKDDSVRINEAIRAREVRVINGKDGTNYGVLTIKEALQKAVEAGLDLIEISPNAQPPVCRIDDYGRFKYDQNKKSKEIKAKTHVAETKAVQVKIGTSEHDMMIKATKAAGWLRDGHRVKVDLFLWGRYKGMGFDFLKERLDRFLAIIPESYKIADDIQKGPKGLTVTLERDRTGKKVASKPTPTAEIEE